MSESERGAGAGPASSALPASAAVPAPPPVHNDRRRRAVGWQSRDALRVASLVIALYLLVKLVWFAQHLFLTAFLGILFGLAVAAGVDRLERFRIPRGVGAALIVLLSLGALVAFGASVAPTLREQGSELRRRLPQAIERVERWIDRNQGGLASLLFRGLGSDTPGDSAAAPTAGADSVRAPVPGIDSARTPPPTPAAAQQPADSMLRPPIDTGQARSPEQPATAPSLGARIGSQLGGLTRYLFPFITSTLGALAGMVLVLFLAIYIAADPDLYRRGMMQLVTPRHRERAGEVFSGMATMLRKWLVTQLIAMVAIGTVTTVTLLILDVKAAFALGVIAGLLEFVPTIGPLISAVPAVAMAFLDSPQKAIYVIIAYTAIQFVENHLLIPLLMKGGIDLPPALTILAQALMAMVFGFLGLMCAVPLLAASVVAVKMLYVEGVLHESAIGPGEDPDEGVE